MRQWARRMLSALLGIALLIASVPVTAYAEPEVPVIAAEEPAEIPTPGPERTPERTEASTEVPAEAPAETPGEVPDEMPAEVPGEMPDEAPDEAPDEVPDEVPDEAPDETPGEVPGEVPDEAPVEAPALAQDALAAAPLVENDYIYDILITPSATEAKVFCRSSRVGYIQIKVHETTTSRSIDSAGAGAGGEAKNLTPDTEYAYTITLLSSSWGGSVLQKVEGTLRTVGARVNSLNAPSVVTDGSTITLSTNFDRCAAPVLMVALVDKGEVPHYVKFYAASSVRSAVSKLFYDLPFADLADVLGSGGNVRLKLDLPAGLQGNFTLQVVAFQADSDLQRSASFAQEKDFALACDTVPLEDIEHVRVIEATEIVTIGWDPSQDARVTGYTVERTDDASHVERFSVPLDKTTFTDRAAQPNTPYTYRVRPASAIEGLAQTNAPGRSDSVRATVTVDSAPPTIALSGIPANGLVSKPGEIGIAVRDNYSLASVTIALTAGESATATSFGGPSFETTLGAALAAFPQGETELVVTAIDGRGAQTVQRAQFIIDTIPPELPTLSDLQQGGVIDASKELRARLTPQDGGTKITASLALDGAPLRDGDTFLAGERLAPGTHSVSASASDAAGNRVYSDYSFTVRAQKAETIALASAEITVPLGETRLANFFGFGPSYANDLAIAARSSDGAIVSASTDGVALRLSARAEGSAEITFELENGITAALIVRVSGLRYELREGHTLDLGALGEIVSIGDKTKLEVVGAGRVKGIAPGESEVVLARGRAVVRVLPRIESIAATGTSLTLGVKDSLHAQNLFTVLDAEGQIVAPSAGEISYKSSNTKVLTVSADGAIYAKATGSATLTATAYNNRKAAIKFTVKKAPTKLSLSPATAVIAEGEAVAGLFKPVFASGYYSAVTYSSSDPRLLVDPATGAVEALHGSAGKVVTITARATNGKSGSAKLTILRPATELIAPERLYVAPGQSARFEVGFLPGEHASVIGAAGESAFAFQQKGRAFTVTGASVGRGTLTLKAGYATAEIEIFVLPDPTQISIQTPVIALGIGDQYQLKPVLSDGSTATLSYKSTKTSVATVSAAGLVSAKKAGTAYVDIATHNKLKPVRVKVVVYKASSTIGISETSVTIARGETVKPFTLTFAKSSYAAHTFSSSDESVVRVDPASGEITGLRTGTATITVTAKRSGKSDSCEVRVLRPAWDLDFANAFEIMGVKENRTLGIRFPAGSTAYGVTWTSSNPSVVSVAGGKLTAKKKGSATITASTFHGLTISRTIWVLNAPSKVSLNISSATMGLGETFRLRYAMPGGSDGYVGYSSSNSAVASVSADGVLTANKAGTATITARTFNGKKATVKVTVKRAPTSATLPEYISGIVGKTGKIAIKYPSGEAAFDPEWVVYEIDQNDNEKLVEGALTIKRDGTLTAHKSGLYYVVLRTYNNVMAGCYIGVYNPPKYVYVEQFDDAYIGSRTYYIGLYRNSRGYLNPTTDTGYDKFTYKSSNSSIVSVNSSGYIVTKKKGTATITITTYGGAKCYVKIKVV